MKRPNYNDIVPVYRKLMRHVRFNVLPKIFMFTFLILIFNTFKVQSMTKGEKELPEISSFDQIPVLVIIAGYDNFYIDAIYTKNKLLCVNVEDLFKTLKINCNMLEHGNSLHGYIENESNTYSINYTTSQIITRSKTINSKGGLIKEMGVLYLESSLFSKAFGINMTFSYRSFSMRLTSDFELPVLKELRREKMRSNMSKIKDEVIPDTVLNRKYHLFKIGTLDWSASSTQIWNVKAYNQLGLGIGTELLFGEADLSVNLYDRQKFNFNQLNYLWRWVDNDVSLIRQAQVGKLSTSTISSVNAPVVGVTIRNSPTTVRKASGYYTINDKTEPNWTVELYINNVMVDYTTADVSGLYVFKVPIVYGYTTLKLKFYGTMGEERTEERTMNVPYTIMPVNGFEYGLTAGIVQDNYLSRMGKAEFNYGLNKFMTIGGGLEYLSSIPNAPFIPFATLTIQPFSKLTLNAQYSHGVKTSGLLYYYFVKDALLEIDYTKYVEGELATSTNALEERKIIFSFPLKFSKLTGFSKLNFTQFVYKTLIYNQADMIFSTYYNQISANSTTQLYWTSPTSRYISSNLALSYRLKNGYTMRPSAQYIVNTNQLMSYELNIEKSFPKGNISISYRRDVLANDNTLNVNFKFDLNFARVILASTYSNGQLYSSENVQGSLAFGTGKNKTHVSNNSSIGKGGLSLYPFLDLNRNGIFDLDEPMVKLNAVKIFGANAIFSKKDSIVRIPDLNAFTYYTLEFDNNSLNNIGWRFKHNLYKILIDPNQFKRVNIPIVSVGEINGMAYFNSNNALKGIGRIIINIFNKNTNKEVTETLSESDGYINYLGLEPGEYIARIDSTQLNKLGMVSSPKQIAFKISGSLDGDIVDSIDFTLSLEDKEASDTAISLIKADSITDIIANANFHKLRELINEKIATISNEGMVLQFGAFNIKSNAIALSKKLANLISKPINVVHEVGYYKVQISGFTRNTIVWQVISNMTKSGFYVYQLPALEANYSIVLGEYEQEEDALREQKKWRKVSKKQIIILINKNNNYTVKMIGLSGKEEAETILRMEFLQN